MNIFSCKRYTKPFIRERSDLSTCYHDDDHFCWWGFEDPLSKQCVGPKERWVLVVAIVFPTSIWAWPRAFNECGLPYRSPQGGKVSNEYGRGERNEQAVKKVYFELGTLLGVIAVGDPKMAVYSLRRALATVWNLTSGERDCLGQACAAVDDYIYQMGTNDESCETFWLGLVISFWIFMRLPKPTSHTRVRLGMLKYCPKTYQAT